MPKLVFLPARITTDPEELIQRVIAAGHSRAEIERAISCSERETGLPSRVVR